MRARLALLIIAVTSASVLSWAPSHGEGALVVSAFNNYFDDAVLDTARANDVVTFSFQEGSHDAVAYDGGGFNTRTRASGDRVDIVFPGGVLRYRCTMHSNINLAATPPLCVGMCGVVADRPLDVTPPRVEITSPKERSINTVTPTISERGDVSFPMTFAGSASDDVGVFGVRVRIYDSGGKAKEYDAGCQFCPGRAADWSLTVGLGVGSYLAEAIAADPSGNRAVTRRISFTVL